MRRSCAPFGAVHYALMALGVLACMLLCVCVGSVSVPVPHALGAIHAAVWGLPAPDGAASAIILSVRLPRVLCVALCGAALSLCGAAMQGLLRNPLADGSTLGVASGASLGAVLALTLGINVPWLPYAGTMVMAMAFAFASLVLILTLAYALDRSLATHSIILIGVIFSMFVSSVMNLVISFAGEKVRSITFWTMGSLSGSNGAQALILLGALAVCGPCMLCRARALNAFSVSEENALSVGVDVRRVKLHILLAASALIGVCVSVGGTIAFVGLAVPHMARMVVGTDHRRLMPASLFGGAAFLLLCDLAARTLLSPVELSIGVVTSLVGAVMFMCIFYRSRKGR